MSVSIKANPGVLFSRESIKFYEYLWVILGAIVATALYDSCKPEHSLRLGFLLFGYGWASVCSFNIYRKLDEVWQKALRRFDDSLNAYDEELFTKRDVKKLRVWFYAGCMALSAAVAAGFIL
jgi:hypothetical protein